MRFHFRAMTEADAAALVTWQYPAPYAFYDFADEELEGILAERDTYVVVDDDAGSLAGFFSFGPGGQVPGGQQRGAYGEDALDVGLGLRPDLTGKGLGLAFVEAGLAYARAKLRPRPMRFRLTVATFNERAIRVYARAGFAPVTRFLSPVRGVDAEFVLMVTPDGARDAAAIVPEDERRGRGRSLRGRPRRGKREEANW